MPITSRATLVAAYTTWVKHAKAIPLALDCLQLAEARMAADIGQQRLEERRELVITDAVAQFDADMLEIVELKMQGARLNRVEITSRERIEWMREQAHTGDRTYACIVGRTIEVYPNTTGTLDVMAKCFPALENDDGTNWILANHPNAYLFGMLMEAADILEDDAALSRWGLRYAEAMAQINLTGGYRGSNGTMRVHGVR
jgi:hypothetical protein